MIVTREQAKDKQCCNNITTSGYCIADKCMAWIWYKTEKGMNPKNSFGITTFEYYVPIPEDEWTGYCGLAKR